MDDEHRYRVTSGRDGRFDGTFVTAVLTTGVYCRPSCPARTPKRDNVRFYPTPAAAQDAGFRACKRCRPDAAPGSPQWDGRADVVARAVRAIGDGLVEREGVAGLAGRLGYSTRQLNRLMSAELGTGPLRLATAHRVQHARALLESSDLPVTQVAWAAGFGSVRQFNDRLRATYGLSPTQIRAGAGRRAPSGGADGGPGPGFHRVVAHLTYRPPLDLHSLLTFLGRRAVAGVEVPEPGRYRTVLHLPHGLGVGEVSCAGSTAASSPAGRPLACVLHLQDIRDYPVAVSRLRRLLDLDADPAAVLAALGDDPVIGALVSAVPGRRVPGTVSPWETALRAVVGQQVSLATARSLLGRLAARFGSALGPPPDPTDPPGPPGPGGPENRGLRVALPTAAELAAADPAAFSLPCSRATALHRLATAVAAGVIDLSPGGDRDRTERQLLTIPGIGAWTAAYIRMRGLGDPDTFPAGDLTLERALSATGGTSEPAAPQRWRPWRSYAAAHLWAAAEPAPARPAAGPKHE